jgi:hypothetical protein
MLRTWWNCKGEPTWLRRCRRVTGKGDFDTHEGDRPGRVRPA